MARVVETAGGLSGGQVIDEVSSEGLVAPMIGVGGTEELFPPSAHGTTYNTDY